MIATTIIIGVVVLALFTSGKHKGEHRYTASFGSKYDHFSLLNHGIAIGPLSTTRKLATTNIFLAGPTGSGKSTIIITPSVVSIARGGSSIVVNDVSGELFERTSGYLSSKGYRILRIDFTNSRFSESFNVLLLCRTISDIQQVCLLVIRNSMGEAKTEIFWEQSSIALLAIFIRYLVFYAEPKYRTLQNVLHLLNKFAVDSSGELAMLFIKTNDKELISAYKAMLVVGEKTLQSIIISTRVALNLWNDPEVCRTTTANTIDFEELRTGKQPVAIFVSTPLQKLDYTRPISAIFFQSLFDFILSRIPSPTERCIFILLDEFASMTFPNITTTINNIRKTNASICICVQDEMALWALYTQAEAHQIKTNCGCQIFLPSQPLHTCKELSQILGKYTVIDEETGKEKGTRELMSVDEIRLAKKAIVLINGAAPCLMDLTPYYDSFWLRKLAHSKPSPLHEKQAVELHLIPLK